MQPVGSSSEENVTMLSVGTMAPDIDLVDHLGGRWRLAEHRGRPCVVIFHRHLA